MLRLLMSFISFNIALNPPQQQHSCLSKSGVILIAPSSSLNTSRTRNSPRAYPWTPHGSSSRRPSSLNTSRHSSNHRACQLRRRGFFFSIFGHRTRIACNSSTASLTIAAADCNAFCAEANAGKCEHQPEHQPGRIFETYILDSHL